LPAAIIVIYASRLILGFCAVRRRKRDLLAWAETNHLSFSGEPYYGLDDDHPTFRHLQGGAGSFADNLLEGKWRGRAFQAFDFHCIKAVEVDENHDMADRFAAILLSAVIRRGLGRNFSAIILESDVPLKPLSIRAEGASDRLADFLGFDEIKFESAEFSREFHVKSADRKWAYDVLNPRAMEFLLSMPRFEIQFDEKAIMVHRSRTFSAQDFEAAAKVAQGLLDGLPEYVKEDEQARA
jgi:hypothetical protein